jgi:hypothetical protein
MVTRNFSLYVIEVELTQSWFLMNGLRPAALHFNGATGGSVELRVSNRPTRPLDSDDEVPTDILVTEDKMVVIDHPFKWIKLKVISPGPDPLHVWLVASV